jgi:hypothetical protein
MVRNVLLMFSTDQRPDPVEEIRWHAERSARGERTAVATTRILSGMTRGRSIVAFYGNSRLGNRLIGFGTFAGYARSTSERGKRLLAANELYKGANLPMGIKGLVELIDVRLAGPDDSVDSLNGVLEGSSTALSLITIPEGPARLQIYFLQRPP